MDWDSGMSLEKAAQMKWRDVHRCGELGEAVAALWRNRKASSHLVDCFAMELRLSQGRGAAAGRSMSRGRGLHGCGNRSQNRFFGLQIREPPYLIASR